MESARLEYELFIVHAAPDEPFVRGHLLPALGIASDLVLLSSELRLGAQVAAEIERGVQNSRLTVVVLSPAYILVYSLRSDFWGALAASALWQDARDHVLRVDIGPLRGAALRAAIERPAYERGVYFEPDLVERLISDAGSEPGILPHLQETMTQLWDRRRLRLVVLSDYEALGDGGRSGLAAAISRRAETTLCTLNPRQRAVARRILVRLVSFGEGRADTRRQQPRAALHAVEDPAADFEIVLGRLIDARLLTIDGDLDHEDALVDLAHEAMISAWPTLARWVQSLRTDELRRRDIEAAAKAWIRLGQGTGGLLDAVELAEIQAWRQTAVARELGQSAEVVAFLAASEQALQPTQGRERRRKPRPLAVRGLMDRPSGCRTRHVLPRSLQGR